MNLEEAAGRLISCLKGMMQPLGPDGAIAFSGGIDSTLLMHLSDYRFKAYTVGVTGSRDFENADFVSGKLGFSTERIVIGEKEVTEALRSLKSIDTRITAVEAGYETVLFIALSTVREGFLVTGQGSDELFYGYRKFLEGTESNTADLEKLHNITLPRERKLAEFTGMPLVTPYLSSCVSELASEITKELCIINGLNKAIVRKAAELSGIPREIALMPKKAAQYGSGVQKLIRNIGLK